MPRRMFMYTGPVTGLKKALRDFSTRGGRTVWEPVEVRCPYCWEWAQAEWDDVGVGLEQAAPYYCDHCGATSIGPFDDWTALAPVERKTGWYRPSIPVCGTVTGDPVAMREVRG